MEFDNIYTFLENKYGENVNKKVEYGCNFIMPEVNISKDLLNDLYKKFDFSYLVDIVGVHWPKRDKKFDVIYNLYSVGNKIRAFVKVAIIDEKIETVSDIWKSAIFLEREQYDLVGIEFKGHPDLRRILLPDYFKKHPLRKDFDLKDRSWFNDVDEQGLGIKYSK